MSEEAPSVEGLDRTTEQFLWGIILFVQRIVVTTFDFLFRPSLFRRVTLNQSGIEYPLQPPLEYAAPTSYLVVSSVICTVYGYWAARSPAGSKLLLESPVFRPFQALLLLGWNAVKDLNFGKVTLLMLPIVFLVFFHSLGIHFICRLFRQKAQFSIIFGLTSYLVGTYLFLHSILFAYTLVLAAFHSLIRPRFLVGLFLSIHIPVGLTVLLAMVRYVGLLAGYLQIGRLATGAILICSSLVSTILVIVATVLLFPVLFNR